MVTHSPTGQGTGYTKHCYLNTESKQDTMCSCPLCLAGQETIFGLASYMKQRWICLSSIISETGIGSIEN
jgi:hypothetical protein